MAADLNRSERQAGGGASDAGVTLIEMIVAMAVTTLLIAIGLTVVVTVVKSTSNENARGAANDQVRVAVQQVEQQVRSGNVLYAPAIDPVTGDTTVRVYTQVNASEKCVEWRFDPTAQTLSVRSWSPTWQTDGLISGWRSVASDIVNSSSQPPFALDPTPAYGGRLLDIDLYSKEGLASGNAAEIKASVAGRNTSYNYNQAICATAPTG